VAQPPITSGADQAEGSSRLGQLPIFGRVHEVAFIGMVKGHRGLAEGFLRDLPPATTQARLSRPHRHLPISPTLGAGPGLPGHLPRPDDKGPVGPGTPPGGRWFFNHWPLVAGTGSLALAA
jgi:hypothetical protein